MRAAHVASRQARDKETGHFGGGGGNKKQRKSGFGFLEKWLLLLCQIKGAQNKSKRIWGGGAGSWGCFEDDRVPRRAVHPPLGDDGEAGREHVKVDEVPHATHCLGVCMRPVVGEQQTRVVVGHADTRVAECVHLDGNA